MAATPTPAIDYIPSDEIKAGDVLPDKSRWPVHSVTIVPRSHVTVVHGGGYIWHAYYGGADFGWHSVRVERSA